MELDIREARSVGSVVSYRSDSLGIRRVTSTPSKTSSLERNRKLLKGRVLVMLASLIVQKT